MIYAFPKASGNESPSHRLLPSLVWIEAIISVSEKQLARILTVNWLQRHQSPALRWPLRSVPVVTISIGQLVDIGWVDVFLLPSHICLHTSSPNEDHLHQWKDPINGRVLCFGFDTLSMLSGEVRSPQDGWWGCVFLRSSWDHSSGIGTSQHTCKWKWNSFFIGTLHGLSNVYSFWDLIFNSCIVAFQSLKKIILMMSAKTTQLRQNAFITNRRCGFLKEGGGQDIGNMPSSWIMGSVEFCGVGDDHNQDVSAFLLLQSWQLSNTQESKAPELRQSTADVIRVMMRMSWLACITHKWGT